MKEELLSELSRAEDIFLGAMGFSEDAVLTLIERRGEDLYLTGKFKSDGESFRVCFDCEIGDLESWALEVLKKNGKVSVL